MNHQRKLRWLCEEMQESVLREQRQRKLLQDTKDQLSTLGKSWDSEKTSLQQRLDQQDRLLNSLSTEKKGISGCMCRSLAMKMIHTCMTSTELAILANGYF